MATTGTGTGSDFSGLNDMLKEVYTEPFENNVESEQEILSAIDAAEGFEVVEGPDGKKINLGHIFSSGGGVGAMNEDDYLPTATNPTTRTSSLTIKQFAAVVELSGRTLRRVKEGPAAFISWADEALPRKAQRLAFHKDRQALGLGDGVICQLTGTIDGTGDAITNAFGIAGLEGAHNLLLRDDAIRYAAGRTGTTPRTGNLLVTRTNPPASFTGNGTISTATLAAPGTPATATSAAANDFVFLGDGALQSWGTREMMGLEGIIDNGDLLASFQGLTRADFPELQAQVIDASSGTGWGGVVSEDLLDFANDLCFERGNMGKPTQLLGNRSAVRGLLKQLRSDRNINDPRGSYAGEAGYSLDKAKGLPVQLGDRTVMLKGARKVPISRLYGIDPRSIKRFRNGSGRWDDTDGSIWNRVVDGTGRRDAYFAVYIEEENMGAGDPASCFKITGLAAA